MITLWLACAGPRQVVQQEQAEERSAPETPWLPAGEVVDGVYRDHKGFTVDVREGWIAKPGADFEQRRLLMQHVPTGAVLEIAVYPEAGLWPRERPGCHWTFQDSGPYGLPPVGRDVTVSTCTPRDAPGDEPERVLGWYVLEAGMAWHFEATMPRGYLAPGRAAAEEVLATVRLP